MEIGLEGVVWLRDGLLVHMNFLDATSLLTKYFCDPNR